MINLPDPVMSSEIPSVFTFHPQSTYLLSVLFVPRRWMAVEPEMDLAGVAA